MPRDWFSKFKRDRLPPGIYLLLHAGTITTSNLSPFFPSCSFSFSFPPPPPTTCPDAAAAPLVRVVQNMFLS